MLALALRTVTLVAAVAVAGCGKYLPPIPPEMVAPKEVQALEVFTTPSQVGFKWQAPNEDRRGQELKAMGIRSSARRSQCAATRPTRTSSSSISAS